MWIFLEVVQDGSASGVLKQESFVGCLSGVDGGKYEPRGIQFEPGQECLVVWHERLTYKIQNIALQYHYQTVQFKLVLFIAEIKA